MNAILEKKIKMPKNFSVEASDLLEKLLVKNPNERIGCMENGVADIKSHPFFSEIDWEKLIEKQIPPPFIPGVSEADDVSNVDPEFLAETPSETPCEDNPLMKALTDETQFDNFTFVNEQNLSIVDGRMSNFDPNSVNKSTSVEEKLRP